MENSNDSEWKEVWQQFHEWIDKVAAAEGVAGNKRPCPLCGAECLLCHGRLTRKWRWSHPRLLASLFPSPCRNSRLENYMWCDTPQESLQQPMFKDAMTLPKDHPDYPKI